MADKLLIVLCFIIGFTYSAEGATIKRITKTKKMIELLADADEILELRPGGAIILKIDETEATAVVKKVSPGNKVLIDVTGGDLSLLKKGAVVTIAVAEPTTGVDDPAVAITGKVMKVNKKNLQILTQVDAEWAVELAKLEVGAELFVVFDGIKEPVPLYFEKINKTAVVFSFDSKNIALMTKATQFTPVTNSEGQAEAIVGVNVLPWFTFPGTPGLWMQKGQFIEAGYRYLDFKENIEVDGNTSENTSKVNGEYVGGKFSFDIYRVGLNIEQALLNDGIKVSFLKTALSLGVHTGVLDFGIDIASLAGKVASDFYNSKNSRLRTMVNIGYSDNWFGLFAGYLPRAKGKVSSTIEIESSGAVEEREKSLQESSSAEAGFWVRATSKVLLKMQLFNNFNDGSIDDEKDEKILANNRVGYNIGATNVGDVMQFSVGMVRNQSGLIEGDILYSHTTPLTGLYLGTAAVFNGFAFGINYQWQRGAMAQKNDEYDVDAVTKNTLKLFSLNFGLML